MAGHSKWANIQHRKSAVDAKRGKLFTRLIKEITVAARLGGGDPTGNPRLRSAIQEARGNNVPNDNIDRAIKKGTGELDGEAYEEYTYEGYGPGGVAVMVETVTDNKNRTVSEVRHIFSRHGGNLGENGCVAWMFERRGYLVVDREAMDEEAFLELALELEVDDMDTEDSDGYVLYTAAEDYIRVLEELESREIPLVAKKLILKPQNNVEVTGEAVPKILRFMEALDDHDDVQSTWANFDIDDAELAAAADG
jgi:YebC/PmpR family DNA-binding regulatory protein